MTDIDREKILAFASEQIRALHEDMAARLQDDPEDVTAHRMSGGAAALSLLISGVTSGWFDVDSWPRTPVEKIKSGPKVRRQAPGTSWEAALSQTPEKSRPLYQAIMLVLSRKPEGCTDDELRKHLSQFLEKRSLAPESVTMRRGELRDAGWVRDSRNKRPSDLGASMTVWEAVPEEGI